MRVKNLLDTKSYPHHTQRENINLDTIREMSDTSSQFTASVSSSDVAGQRLYEQALEKQFRLEEAVRTKSQIHKPKLDLPSKETFSGMEDRDYSGIPRYERLYEDAKLKNKYQREMETEKPKPVSARRNSGCERLYALTKAKQEEGKQRREEIKRSTAPPPPKDFKKIPLSQATAMYERSMLHLINKEMNLMDAAHEREDKYESVLIPESVLERSDE